MTPPSRILRTGYFVYVEGSQNKTIDEAEGENKTHNQATGNDHSPSPLSHILRTRYLMCVGEGLSRPYSNHTRNTPEHNS